MTTIEKLRERKLGQWAIAYLAGAWLALQGIDVVGGYFRWPDIVGQVATVLLAIGFLGVLVLAWYHGEKGEQRVSGPELVMIAALLLIAGVGIAFVSPAQREATGQSSASHASTVTPSPTPVAEQGSIAVLPFTDMSPERDQEYFSDGITEELLNVLAQLPELRVAARTSAFAFKGKDVGIDSIARALNVRHVLEGSVRKAGDQVRITAQLIDASTGYHLWSDTYDRELEDVFAVQDEISRAIVNQLQIELAGGRDQGRLARVETTDPEAHTLYLKAYQIMLRSTEEALAEGEALLRQALERDPEYAQAHSLLATVLAFQVLQGWSPTEKTYTRAEAEARRALALNPGEARAHYVLGQIAWWRDWDWTAAERHFARAIEVNPGFSPAYSHRALLLVRLGRSEEAIRSATRAVELDPVSTATYANVGLVYVLAGKLEKAEEAYREALRLSPGHPFPLGGLTYTLADLGRHAEAVRTAEQAVGAAPENPGVLAGLAYAHARAGNRAEAERLLRRLEAMPEVGAHDLANVHAGLGNRQRVLELLEKAYEKRETGTTMIGVDPTFRDYWQEPRVRRLLERMGLPAGS